MRRMALLELNINLAVVFRMILVFFIGHFKTIGNGPKRPSDREGITQTVLV